MSEIERLLWWAVVLAAFRYAWLSYRKAKGVNEEGTIMLAKCVVQINRNRKFVPPGTRVIGTHRFAVNERRYKLSVEEVGNDG